MSGTVTRPSIKLLVVLAAVASIAGAVAAELKGRELVDALRDGGYNIYFRHAQTDWSQDDDIRDAEDLKSCDGARVRQLSGEGRETSAAVGRAIRALKIPIGRILASPYCRTMDTARLMDLGVVEATEDLTNLRSARYAGGSDAVIARTRALLASTPKDGANTILVAHGNVARNATPVYPGEAEGVVFRPDGAGGFEVVARITPEEWSALAERFDE